MKPAYDASKAHDDGDTLPEQAGVYVPPRPLAQLSDHRTMDIKAIRLAAELDPRQARTQLRLQAPPRRRGVSLWTVASVMVVVLLGVVSYVTFASEAPLPLLTSDPTAPAPAAQPAPTVTDLPSPTAAPLATQATTLQNTVPPAPTEDPTLEFASPASTGASPVQTSPARVPHATRPASTPTAPHAASRPTKVIQDPWLE